MVSSNRLSKTVIDTACTNHMTSQENQASLENVTGTNRLICLPDQTTVKSTLKGDLNLSVTHGKNGVHKLTLPGTIIVPGM